MSIETPRHNIAGIQGLRGAAALMIVFYHLNVQLERMDADQPWPVWLTSGVDVFFVISGFIMWVSTEADPSRGPLAFMRHRIRRIVPLYWILTLGVVLALLIAPGLVQSGAFDAEHTVKSLFFVPARHPAVDAIAPVIIAGWTLNYEMFFYVLFAVSLGLSRGSSLVKFSLINGLVLAALAVANISQGAAAAFYGNPVMIDFLFGVALGWLYTARRLPRSPWWTLAIAGGFAALGLTYDLGGIATGAAAAVVVCGAAHTTHGTSSLLRALGDSSYSLYLSHGITLSAVGQLWRLGGLDPGYFAAAGIASSIGAGWLLYRGVELPLTQVAKSAWPQGLRSVLSSVLLRPRAP